jgi:hypothetical protein
MSSISFTERVTYEYQGSELKQGILAWDHQWVKQISDHEKVQEFRHTVIERGVLY